MRQRLVGGEDSVAQACKVARAAAPNRQPRQRARQIGRRMQRGAEIVAQAAIRHKGCDRIQPPRNRTRYL